MNNLLACSMSQSFLMPCFFLVPSELFRTIIIVLSTKVQNFPQQCLQNSPFITFKLCLLRKSWQLYKYYTKERQDNRSFSKENTYMHFLYSPCPQAFLFFMLFNYCFYLNVKSRWAEYSLKAKQSFQWKSKRSLFSHCHLRVR